MAWLQNVAYVEDDECLYIDRVFTFKTHSITTGAFKQMEMLDM